MDAAQMINNLLKSLKNMGSDLNYLRAKVTGGAQVYESSLGIGLQNTQVVLQQLLERKIYIAAMDVGGRVSRTARFNSVTNELHISTSEQKMYSI